MDKILLKLSKCNIKGSKGIYFSTRMVPNSPTQIRSLVKSKVTNPRGQSTITQGANKLLTMG